MDQAPEDLNEIPDTPTVNEDTPTSEEDSNEFLFGEDEIGDDVKPRATKREEDDE